MAVLLQLCPSQSTFIMSQIKKFSSKDFQTSNGIVIRKISAQELPEFIPKLADIMIDTVEGGACINFFHPLKKEDAIEWWHNYTQGVEDGEKVVFVAIDSDLDQVVGTVSLGLKMPQNQFHRGEVAKMLLKRSHRKRGIALNLMDAMEKEAIAARKTVLVLDTITGGDGERLYQRSGWIKVGSIPNFCYGADGTTLCSTTYYYKQLSV